MNKATIYRIDVNLLHTKKKIQVVNNVEYYNTKIMISSESGCITINKLLPKEEFVLVILFMHLIEVNKLDWLDKLYVAHKLFENFQKNYF
jgi:hypothetical protein